MIIGETVALAIWTFVDKVMSPFFNMLSGLVIAFLPRSKHLLISWLLSLSAVMLEPKKIKSVSDATFSPPTDMKWYNQYHNLSFFNVEFQASFFTLLFHSQEAL